MTCQDSIELMQRYLDHDLNDAEEQELQLHLQQCAECSEMFDRLRRLDSELAQLPKVTPAFSLVDAILPKLAELDRQPGVLEETAAREPEATAFVPLGGIPRTRRSFVSWKWFSGAAVAAAIIGVFVLKDQNLLVTPSMGKKDMAATAGSTSTTSKSAERAAAPAATADGKKNAPAEQPKLGDGISTLKSNAKDKSGSGTAYSAKSQPAPAANSDQKADSSAAPGSEPKQQDRQMARNDANGRVVVSSPLAPNGESTSNDPSAAGSNPTQPAANPPMGIAAVPNEKPTQEQTPKAKSSTPGNPVGAMSLAPPQKTELPSADGKLLAVVEKNKVIVRSAATGDTVYASVYGWTEQDVVSLVGWSEENLLTYRVQHNEGADTVVIDMTAKTETKSGTPAAETP